MLKTIQLSQFISEISNTKNLNEAIVEIFVTRDLILDLN
jgi:hypothetical protein